jgi:quinohemoprotein amine dehydrogenase
MRGRKDQDLSGTWKICGFQPGMGCYEGTYTFKANPKGEDEYFVEREVVYANGARQKTAGDATLYGEYHLRYALAPTAMMGAVEGVFDLDAAKNGFAGKWWTVVQDTNSYGDEMFYKMTGAMKVFGRCPMAIKASGAEEPLTLIGVNLPGTVRPGDISFGNPDVKCAKVVENDSGKIVCHVVANRGASVGPTTVSVKGVACESKVTIYDKVNGIKILPRLGRARVSCGAAYPAHGVQFVAWGLHFGKDGKRGTADDLMLNPVDADWWLEEEKTRDGDDDLKWVKAPIVNGLYTPVTTYGPIKERFQWREGIGLIAVGARYEGMNDRVLLGVTDTDFVTHIK